MNNIDSKALKILFDAFSSKALAGRSPESVASDFEYAKSQGIMFDNVALSHDLIIQRALHAVGRVEKRDIANAFVSSLTSRRLDLRSALGSFAVLRHLPLHRVAKGDSLCAVCGEYNKEFIEDLNCLNMERFKYGGVRHHQPLYAALDLELFGSLAPVTPSSDDIKLLRALLVEIENAPPQTTSAQLERFLPKNLRSNKNERDVLIEILGLCGILGSNTHPGFMNRFIPYNEREVPSRRFVDMAYPACWWTSSDGIRHEAISYWFGHLLD